MIALAISCNCFADDAQPADAIVLPEGGRELVTFAAGKGIKFQSVNVKADAQWSGVEQMPFSQLYRIESDTRFSDPKNMQLQVPLSESIAKGDVVLLSFWIRRPKGGGQPNNVYLSIGQSMGSEICTKQLSAYDQWQQYVRSFIATDKLDTEKGLVQFNLGESGEVIEIADLRLINYGPDWDQATLPRSTVMYRGRQADAAWRAEALDRIERIRKGDLTVEVVDADGNAISDAKVSISMQKHAFGFGNVVNSEVLGADGKDFPITPKKDVVVKWKEAKQYRETVAKYFDRVTFESEMRPFPWQRMQGKNPVWRRKYSILMTKTFPWLQENDITVRGHYLGWAPMDFNEFEKRFVGDPEAHRKWLWAHMNDVLKTTDGLVTEWDTINHIIGWGQHTYDKEYGTKKIYADIMAEARRLAPSVTHAINEGRVLPGGTKRERYKKIIQYLNEQGQPADVVGFMAHFGLTSLTPPEELLEVYDDFAEVAPRLQLSEFDVDAGDDEQLQADYFRDVMIATFSHPNMGAIVQWGFWERMHWKPAAALWRDDWTIKPAGQVFVDLVSRQWWTDETRTTDQQGRCSIRGYLGEYEVTVEHEGQSKVASTSIDREGATLQIQLGGVAKDDRVQ
jgi:GH35 family endo-1,4-beta-xylanase